MKYLLPIPILLYLILFIPDRQISISKAQMMIDKHAETIEKLIACESNGVENAIHKLDGDGTDSVGVLQFKWKTFSYYSQKYELFPLADESDMQNLWHDKYAQKLVAAHILENEKNGLCHWEICSKSFRNYKCKGE